MKLTKTAAVVAGALMAFGTASAAYAGGGNSPAPGGAPSASGLNTQPGERVGERGGASPSRADLAGTAAGRSEVARSWHPRRGPRLEGDGSLVQRGPRSTSMTLNGIPMGGVHSPN